MTMTILHGYSFTIFSFHPTPVFACAFRPKTSAETPNWGNAITTPARDRVLEFGKHKGKMLGSLPSTYLKWVSKNLRARDFEEWANLADQVLQDPIYQDRIEWEFADNILRGNRPTSSARNESNGVVSELLEISERFGWDNEDKSGWRNVNFELLGTSKGGRIPRINRNGGREKLELKIETENVDGGRRRERRDRLRLKREASRIESETQMKFENGVEIDESTLEKRRNRFPGREALLRNVLNRGRK